MTIKTLGYALKIRVGRVNKNTFCLGLNIDRIEDLVLLIE